MTTVAERRTEADGSRYYMHPVTGERLMSVTTVLGATDGKPYLTEWSARLAAEFAVEQRGLVRKVLRRRGFQAAVDLIKGQARLLRQRKADAGTYVHDVQEALILWASPAGDGGDIVLPTLPDHLVGTAYDEQPLEDVVGWMVDGFLAFVDGFKPEFEATEMAVYNRALGIAGTLDMIVRLRGVALASTGYLVAAPTNALTLCVDTKTGRYLDSTVQEQIAAYRRMKEACLPLGEIRPMPPTDAGAILHLRPEHHDGYRLMPVSHADDAKAWNRFRRAVELATGRAEVGSKPGKVARPLNADGTMPSPLLEDMDGDGYPRILTPLIKAGFSDVADVALMSLAEIGGINGIGPKGVETIGRMLGDHNLAFAPVLEPAEVA